MAANYARGARRLGIVLSLIWFVGFGAYLWHVETAPISDYFALQYRVCYDFESTATDRANKIEDQQQKDKALSQAYDKTKACLKEAEDFYLKRFADERSAIWALVGMNVLSIALIWFIVWVVWRTISWVLRGFTS